MQLLMEAIKTPNQAALEIAHYDLINLCWKRVARSAHGITTLAVAMILSSTNVCFSVPLPHDERSRYLSLSYLFPCSISWAGNFQSTKVNSKKMKG